MIKTDVFLDLDDFHLSDRTGSSSSSNANSSGGGATPGSTSTGTTTGASKKGLSGAAIGSSGHGHSSSGTSSSRNVHAEAMDTDGLDDPEDNAPLFYSPGIRGFYSPRQGKGSYERLNAFRNVGRLVTFFGINLRFFRITFTQLYREGAPVFSFTKIITNLLTTFSHSNRRNLA